MHFTLKAVYLSEIKKYVVFCKNFLYNENEYAARSWVRDSRTLAKMGGAFAPHTLIHCIVVQCFVARCI